MRNVSLNLGLNLVKQFIQLTSVRAYMYDWQGILHLKKDWVIYARNLLSEELLVRIYLSLSIHRSILRSCDRKFVFRFWCRSRRCHRNKEKGTVKSQIFVCGKIFPKKSSHRENSQTNYLYINKSLQKICCSFFEALSINENFQLNYSRFNSTQ